MSHKPLKDGERAVVTSTTLTNDDYKKMRALADAAKTSVSHLLRDLVARYLKTK
jgi:hypothetical protein